MIDTRYQMLDILDSGYWMFAYCLLLLPIGYWMQNFCLLLLPADTGYWLPVDVNGKW